MSFDTAWPSSKTRDIEITYSLYSKTSARLPRINELQILAGQVVANLLATERILPANAGEPLSNGRRPRNSYSISAPINVRPGRIHIKGNFLSEMDQYEIFDRVPVIHSNILANVPGSGIDSVPTAELRQDFEDCYDLIVSSIPEFDLGELVLSNVKFMSVNFGVGVFSFPS